MHIDLFEPLQRIDRLQQLLQVGQRQVDVQRHQVGQACRVVDVVDHLHDIIRQRLAVGKGYLQQGIQALHQRLGYQALFHEFPHQFAMGQDEGGFLDQGGNPDPGDPFQGCLCPAVGKTLNLGYLADAADLVEIRGYLPAGVAFQLYQRHQVIEVNRLVERSHFIAGQEERKTMYGKATISLSGKRGTVSGILINISVIRRILFLRSWEWGNRVQE